MIPKYNHMYPIRERAEGDLTTEDNVTTEVQITRMQPQAKEYQNH